MAVDGKQFSDTLNLGLDEWFEFPCSPCTRDGKNLPAIKYCVECDENFCSNCLMHHNRFPVMRVHQITDNLSSQAGQRPQLPIERCDRHGGKIIDVYCPTHDVVGCSTCISVEHSSCHGIRYIPDLTTDLKLSKEVDDLETKLKLLLSSLDQVKQEKQNQIQFLQQEKDKLLKEIQVLRKRINDKLDEMEKMIFKEVDTKIGTQVRNVSKDIDVISNEKTTLEKRQTSINNAKTRNNAELFIQIKMGQADIQKSEQSSELMRTESHTMKMRILPNSNVHRLLESKSSTLGKTSVILIPKCTKHDSDVNVRLPLDQKPCIITGICVTSEGDGYLADGPNKRIKKLDQSDTVTEHLDLPDCPGALCEADNTRLAVTLVSKKKVQFVSRNPLTFRDSFTVGDRCRGIDCHNGQLYVCCGGDRDQGEGPGRIEVYSVGGDLLRSYYQGASEPNFVHVSERGDLIISTGNSTSLVTLRMADHSVSDMQIRALRQPFGMFRVGDGQLCVAGYTSNNIVLISEDGEYQQELLTQKDRISQPYAVCFNKHQSNLIVSFYRSDTIKIFQIAT